MSRRITEAKPRAARAVSKTTGKAHRFAVALAECFPRNAKLVRLAEIERARRRKALDRARVRYNTKKFNELKFKNNLHINEDDKAKEIALKDRKNIEEERIKKNGGWF